MVYKRQLEPQSQFKELLQWAVGVIAAIYAIVLIIFGNTVSPYDYDHLSGYYELAWRFWKVSNDWLPQYNPYLCGGRTLGADPQIPVLSPIAFLIPVFGSTRLIKLEMFFSLALGVWGLFRLLKFLGLGQEKTLWGLFLYLTGGGVISRIVAGHVTLNYYLLYPLFLYLSYKMTKESSSLKFTLIVYWLLFIYCGHYKPNFVIYGLPPLFIECITRSVLTKKWFPMIALVVGSVLCILINAPTYLPAAYYFNELPRMEGSAPVLIAIRTLIANVLLPLRTIPKFFFGSEPFLRHETNIFLGPVAVYFAFLATRNIPKAMWPYFASLLVLLITSIWLGLGSATHEVSPLYMFSWLRAFWPGFESARVPVRFWYGLFVSLIIFSAVGFRLPRSRFQWFILCLLGIMPGLLSAVINSAKTIALADLTQSAVPAEYPQEINLVHTEPFKNLAAIRRGMGVIECIDNIQINQADDLSPGNTLLATTDPPSAKWLSWSRIGIEAGDSKPITLNLNHSPMWHWVGSPATIISKPGERLTIKPTESIISGMLVYKTPKVKEAFAIAVASFVVFVIMVFLVLRHRVGASHGG